MILEVPAPAETHECVAQYLMEFFLGAMRIQQLDQDARISWRYGPNSTHRFSTGEEDDEANTHLTPDGSIYDPEGTLSLITEVANSQTVVAAREKIDEAMDSPNVLGAILVNLEEKQKYKKPGHEWVRENSSNSVDPEEYKRQVVPNGEVWGPRKILGHMFAGEHSCFMEVTVRGAKPVSAVC